VIKENQKIIQRIRSNILKLSYIAKSSHIGSSLSIVEILFVIYFNILKKGDRFILSKGHAALSLYCTIYEKGFIKKKTLYSYGKNKTKLMAHASHKVNGVNFSTGSLGHGLPVALGKALYFKSIKKRNKVFVLISDGELNEGTTWESLLFAAHHKINNLIVILDNNKIQSLGKVNKILKLEPLKKKFESFGVKVHRCDGHNITSLKKAISKSDYIKPTLIIADTTKGKGVSFMENNNLWHYKNPNKLQLEKGLKEIMKYDA
jgi:transketolase